MLNFCCQHSWGLDTQKVERIETNLFCVYRYSPAITHTARDSPKPPPVILLPYTPSTDMAMDTSSSSSGMLTFTITAAPCLRSHCCNWYFLFSLPIRPSLFSLARSVFCLAVLKHFTEQLSYWEQKKKKTQKTKTETKLKITKRFCFYSSFANAIIL